MRLRLTVLALVCASWLSAQQAPTFPRASYFRKMFSTPTGRVELQPPVRLSDFVVDGKLELSLRSYLDLVMANNTDIAVQKLTVDTARNNIMGAFGRFDPTLTGSFSNTRAATPATSQLEGSTVAKQLTQPAQFQYNQTLQTGTQFNLGFNASKTSNNNSFSTYNPALSSNFSFGFTQPLLRGRGGYITRIQITIARARLRSTELNLKSQVISMVQGAEGAYWDVVGARENLKVQTESLALRKESLARSEKELELGALPPLDIFQPQADYATAEISVTQSKFRLAQLEDALRRQIGADLDPRFREVPIVLTEAVTPPTEAGVVDKEALVQKAVESRPDLLAARIGLETDDLTIRQVSDTLRPQLNLTGSYQSNGRGGIQYVRSGFGDSAVTQVLPGGFYDALGQVFAFNFTTYSLRLNLSLPLRDRAGAANLANALVQKKSDLLSLRSREQGLRLDVLNAITAMESSRESVKQSIIARDLAIKQLDAAKLKYDLGTTEMYFVLDAQTRLTAAESSVITNSINYWRNQTALLRATGTLLEERGIVIQ